VGISIREVVHSVALGLDRILPVSSLVNGSYGLRDVCISVPTVVGRKGVLDHLEIELWPKETSALKHSAEVLRETIEAVSKSNKNAAAGRAGAVATSAGTKPSPTSNVAQRPTRVTMGSAGGNGVSGHARVTVSGQSKGSR
jgi:L-lactate dehydrogenase